MPFSARGGLFATTPASLPATNYPDWPTQANTTTFTAETSRYSGNPGTVTTSGYNIAFPNNDYRGCLRHPNGNIYYIGRAANNILEYDPSSNTHTVISGLTSMGSNNFTGGCIGDNGNIYCAPFTATNVLEYNPDNGAHRLISVSISGGNHYNGAVMDTTGNVICIPQNEEKFIHIDCSVEPVVVTTPTYGATFTTAGVISGTTHPNGNVYMAPLQDSGFLEIDPAAGTSTRYDAGKGTGQLLCQGAVTGADGNIYGVSYNSSTILRLDPTDGSVDEPFTHGQGSGAFIGGTAAPNGNIYLAPFDGTNIYQIDPLAGTATTISDGITADDEFVGACSDQSNVYLCPNSADSLYTIPHNGTGGDNANAYTLSAYVNSGH